MKHITIREVVEEEGSGSSGTTQRNNKDSKHVTINDDVEEESDLDMYLNSSDLELVNDGSRGNQTIGLRFRR